MIWNKKNNKQNNLHYIHYSNSCIYSFQVQEKHFEAKKILLLDYINGLLGNKLQLNWLKVKDFEDLKKGPDIHGDLFIQLGFFYQ